MSFLRGMRELVLGETLLIPIGVAILVGLAVLGNEFAGDWWRHAAGPGIALGTASIAVLAIARRG